MVTNNSHTLSSAPVLFSHLTLLPFSLSVPPQDGQFTTQSEGGDASSASGVTSVIMPNCSSLDEAAPVAPPDDEHENQPEVQPTSQAMLNVPHLRTRPLSPIPTEFSLRPNRLLIAPIIQVGVFSIFLLG